MNAEYTESKPAINQWAEEDRPREKMIKHGARYLSDAELLAILLRSGTAKENALELSRRLLSENGNDLMALCTCSMEDLCHFNGIGPAKAVTLKAAFQLGKRIKRKKNTVNSIRSSGDAYHLLRTDMEDLKYEEFWVLLLNRANKVVDRFQLSSGGVAGTVVDVKMLFNKALGKLCSGILLAHNHPSGNLQPSNEDLRITKKIVKAGKFLDIKVLDHIIITTSGYYSFLDEGHL